MALMDPTDLFGALVRGAFATKPHKRGKKALRYLTGRGSGSFLTAGTMLTAAGVAWGLYDTWQSSQGGQPAAGGQWGGGTPPASAPIPTPGGPAGPAAGGPPPIPGAAAPQGSGPAADIPPAVRRVVQLTISAARADGALGEQERTTILEHAQAIGAGAIVQAELDRTTMLSEIASGVTDPKEKEEMYVLAFSIVRADENVTGAERIYLAQLAANLGLDGATVARLEQDAASRIDGQDEPR